MAVTPPTELDDAAQGELAATLAGELVRAGDPSHDERRALWNGSIDRHPALIARCASAPDVIAAVRYAQEAGLETAVRSGGHSFPGHSVCDDGLVIDLGPMKGIHVDPAARVVRAQAGVLLGELDRATQQHGLAVPAGIVTVAGWGAESQKVTTARAAVGGKSVTPRRSRNATYVRSGTRFKRYMSWSTMYAKVSMSVTPGSDTL